MNMCALGCRLLKSLECSSADDYRSANNASVMLKAQTPPQEQVTTFSIISCPAPFYSVPLSLLSRYCSMVSFPLSQLRTMEQLREAAHAITAF